MPNGDHPSLGDIAFNNQREMVEKIVHLERRYDKLVTLMKQLNTTNQVAEVRLRGLEEHHKKVDQMRDLIGVLENRYDKLLGQVKELRACVIELLERVHAIENPESE